MLKISNIPYQGMTPSPAQVYKQPMGNLPSNNQLTNPVLPNQQANTNAGVPQPSTPSISQQVPGGNRMSRGYGNTPVKSPGSNPQGIGRPPVGTKKTANNGCYPMNNSMNNVPRPSITTPMSGMGVAGVGMGLPSMSPMGSASMKSPMNKMSVQLNRNIEKLAIVTGATIGALLGAIAGHRRGNVSEGITRGAIRGGGTELGAGVGSGLGFLAGGGLGAGVGAGIGGLAGALTGGGDPTGGAMAGSMLGAGAGGLAGAGIGTAAGAGLGGYAGWKGTGDILGEPKGDTPKKPKNKPDIAKNTEKKAGPEGGRPNSIPQMPGYGGNRPVNAPLTPQMQLDQRIQQGRISPEGAARFTGGFINNPAPTPPIGQSAEFTNTPVNNARMRPAPGQVHRPMMGRPVPKSPMLP